MSVYTEQANDFLQKTNTTIAIDLIGNCINKDRNETECRDLYKITLTTPKGSMVFDFWNSILDTRINHMDIIAYAKKRFKCSYDYLTPQDKIKARKELVKKKEEAKPTAYDILACLTSYDPGTFEEFCSEFGYDEDSLRALKTYLAVQEEYTNLANLYTSEQMKELQEIQ